MLCEQQGHPWPKSEEPRRLDLSFFMSIRATITYHGSAFNSSNWGTWFPGILDLRYQWKDPICRCVSFSSWSAFSNITQWSDSDWDISIQPYDLWYTTRIYCINTWNMYMYISFSIQFMIGYFIKDYEWVQWHGGLLARKGIQSKSGTLGNMNKFSGC